jgi:hypothetical protein
MRRTCLIAGSITLLALLVFTGCGGGSAQKPPVVVVPTFTNASLSGSYVFTANGVNSSGVFTLLGILTADGKGAITSGHTFFNSIATGFEGNFSTTGTYNVSSNGRTTVNLGVEILGPVALELVLLSDQHGLVVRFDNTATASGSLDKQDLSAFTQTALAGTYVFNLLGTDASGLPEASVGMFTVDAHSTITGGVQDTNDNGVITTNTAIDGGPTSFFGVVGGVGNGVFSFNTGAEGLREYCLIAIDANHLKFISNEFAKLQAGDLFRATSQDLSGSFVFALGGISTNGAFAAGGVLNSNGAGLITGGVEDANNGGVVTLNSPVSGSYIAAGNRIEVTLNGGAVNLAAYPSMGGIQVLELDSSTVASGVAFQEIGTLSNATLNGGYGANLSGVGTAGKFDAVAQVMADGSGHLSGSVSLNDGGILEPNLGLNGSYTLAGNGRATGTLVTSAGTLNVIYYVANSSQILFIEVDNNAVAQGVLTPQQ